jgi:peptidoglycan/LPS O-acetylase OafA/YrhL
MRAFFGRGAAAAPARDAAAGGNFELLGLVAVAIIVYGNGLVLTGAHPVGLWGAPFARIGLDLLFAACGFLAADFWRRAPRPAAYLGHGARRLLPGLLGCVLVTVCVIGPLATTLPLGAYFTHRLTLRYLGNALLIPEFWLPHVFAGRQWAGSVNPMLGALPPGVVAALAVPLLAGRRSRPPLWPAAGCALACAALCLAWSLLLPHLPRPLHRAVFADTLTELPFFFVGVTLRLAAERRGEALWRADLAMLCFAATWVSATWLDSWTLVLEWLTVPYMGLCFGRMSLPVLGRIGAAGRPCYGFYLYAFPLQQLLLERLPGLRPSILACFALALAAGYLSWFLIERPALRAAPSAPWRARPVLREAAP